MIADPFLMRIVPNLAEVSGIEAIVLGGSRARGTADEASDTDIGSASVRPRRSTSTASGGSRPQWSTTGRR